MKDDEKKRTCGASPAVHHMQCCPLSFASTTNMHGRLIPNAPWAQIKLSFPLSQKFAYLPTDTLP